MQANAHRTGLLLIAPSSRRNDYNIFSDLNAPRELRHATLSRTTIFVRGMVADVSAPPARLEGHGD